MKKQTTKNDEYKPTAKQKSLIEVLLNPKYRFLSITAICEKAMINRTSYYLMMENKKFVAYYKTKAKDLIYEAVGPVISAFVKEAKAGSFNHGKVLLEISQVYQDEKTLKHISPDGSMSPTRNFNDFYNDEPDTEPETNDEEPESFM